MGDQLLASQELGQAVRFFKAILLPDCYDRWVIIEREKACRSNFWRALKRLVEQSNPSGEIPGRHPLSQSDPCEGPA